MMQLKFLLIFVCVLGPQATTAELCDPSPCMNGGRCVELDESYGYYCRCNAGFYGVLCEFTELCDPSPCMNGGRCVELDESYGYYCRCNAGFYGVLCEFTELCHLNPCKNDAICVVHDDNHGYNCKCQPGYYGPLCQWSKLCDPTPCKNGATCQLDDTAEFGLGYNCTCKPGYIGLNCEWDGPECTADTTTPCKNNAPCVNSEGRTCVCPKDIGGHYCERERPCQTCPRKTAKCNLYKYSQWGRQCFDVNGVQLD